MITNMGDCRLSILKKIKPLDFLKIHGNDVNVEQGYDKVHQVPQMALCRLNITSNDVVMYGPCGLYPGQGALICC